MHIFRLDPETLAAGRDVFQQYLAGAACGRGSFAYEFGRERPTGVSTVAGSILECIDHGLTNWHDVVSAVTRATRCRATTVEDILDFLTGDDPSLHLWSFVDGRYRSFDAQAVADREQVQTLLAA